MRILATLLCLLSTKAFACSCAPYDIQEAYVQYPAIFVGRVVNIEALNPTGSNAFAYSSKKLVTLIVETNVKGVNTEKVTVTTHADSAACGFPFVEGRQYSVFASGDDELYVNSCSPTAEGDSAATVEPFYESVQTLETLVEVLDENAVVTRFKDQGDSFSHYYSASIDQSFIVDDELARVCKTYQGNQILSCFPCGENEVSERCP